VGDIDKTDSNWCCCLRSLSYMVNYCMSGRVETGVRMCVYVCVYCSIGDNGNLSYNN